MISTSRYLLSALRVVGLSGRLTVVVLGTLFTACTDFSQDPDDIIEDEPLTEAEAAIAPKRAWTRDELAILDTAIARAARISADTVFLAIVRESEAAGEISWKSENLKNLPDSAHARPTSWMLQRLTDAGHFETGEIGVGNWVFDASKGKRTRAKTVACKLTNQLCTTFQTRFHEVIVRDDRIVPLVNTVIHERIHAFGQAHISQKRSKNKCEAPSVVGDIAESLLVRRQQQEPIRPRQTLCDTLEARLRARGIVR